jgi:hypothetical protein
MMAVWETNNEIWINPPTDTDDLDLLSAERMIRMGYGYKSRRRTGRSGNLLLASRLTAAAAFQPSNRTMPNRPETRSSGWIHSCQG